MSLSTISVCVPSGAEPCTCNILTVAPACWCCCCFLHLQVIDDILDITQSTEVLGKTAAKDLASNKTTYPKLLGIEKSKEVRAVPGSNRKLCRCECQASGLGGSCLHEPSHAFGTVSIPLCGVRCGLSTQVHTCDSYIHLFGTPAMAQSYYAT